MWQTHFQGFRVFLSWEADTACHFKSIKHEKGFITYCKSLVANVLSVLKLKVSTHLQAWLMEILHFHYVGQILCLLWLKQRYVKYLPIGVMANIATFCEL